MKNYEIKVNIEIIESENEFGAIKRESDGTFSMTISEPDVFSIDKCEKALLETAYPAIRAKLAEHLSEMSKKKPLKKQKKGKK